MWLSKFLRLLPVFLFCTALEQTNKFVELETKNGRLLGRQLSIQGHEVLEFLGVPYGKAPIGNLRFASTGLVESWEGVRNATVHGPDCYGIREHPPEEFEPYEMFYGHFPFSENCLNLNIWTPKDAENAAVMVWIFGHAFVSGSPSLDLYNGSIMAAVGGVVMININYRLGPFGFLYAGEGSSAPGNIGLSDQQLALKWVRANIRDFGGDPEKVTIFGESAGSGSVSAHLLAPGSQPFFQHAIMLSGTLNAPWGVKTMKNSLEYTMQLLDLLECKKGDMEERLSCARGLSPDAIQDAAAKQLASCGFLGLNFSPLEEDDHFFMGNALDKLKSDQVKSTPVLMGYTTDEVTNLFPIYFLDQFISDNNGIINVSQYWHYMNTCYGVYTNEIVRRAAAYQYTVLSIDNEDQRKQRTFYRDALWKSVDDFFFTCPILDLAQQLTQLNINVYTYHFGHRSSLNRWPLWMGVMHGYELEFIFGMPLRPGSSFTPEEADLSSRILHYLVNFAKYGNPNGLENLHASTLSDVKNTMGSHCFTDSGTPSEKSQCLAETTFWPPFGVDENVMLLKGAEGGGFLVERKSISENCIFWKEVENLCKK